MTSLKQTPVHALVALMATLLFFEYDLGLNALLFSSLMVLAFRLVRQEQELHIPSLLFVFISSCALLLHGSALAVAAYVFAMVNFIATTAVPHASRALAIPYGFIAFLSSGLMSAVAYFDGREASNDQEPDKKISARLLRFLIIAAVVLVFFALYRSSNLVYSQLTNSIDLSFINLPWILFLLVAFYFLFALFSPAFKSQVILIDGMFKNEAVPASHEESELKRRISLLRTGFWLLLVLNLLILSVNFTDIIFLWGGGELPEDVNLSDIVHEGIGSLILSILFAILLLVILFNNKTLFLQESGLPKKLAYAWIGQNIFMVISTAYRNYLYISEYDLTYKRIGVYVYLLLALFGLITSVILLSRNKTFWYLLRTNVSAWMICLQLSSLIHWDLVIARYNVRKAISQNRPADIYYLGTLSPHALPWLKHYAEVFGDQPILPGQDTITTKEWVDRLSEEYFFDHYYEEWRSYNLYNTITKKQLSK